MPARCPPLLLFVARFIKALFLARSARSFRFPASSFLPCRRRSATPPQGGARGAAPAGAEFGKCASLNVRKSRNGVPTAARKREQKRCSAHFSATKPAGPSPTSPNGYRLISRQRTCYITQTCTPPWGRGRLPPLPHVGGSGLPTRSQKARGRGHGGDSKTNAPNRIRDTCVCRASSELRRRRECDTACRVCVVRHAQAGRRSAADPVRGCRRSADRAIFICQQSCGYR